MPFAVTHVILTMVIVDLFRDHFSRKKFPLYFVLIGGIAGLAPDIDIPISWLITLVTGAPVDIHRGITHAVIFPVIFALVSLVSYKTGKERWGLVFGLLSFGWLFHLGLDSLVWAETAMQPLYPFSPVFWHGLFVLETEFAIGLASALDAVILVLWLLHEQMTHKIKDYI
jgi:hypothetical protein